MRWIPVTERLPEGADAISCEAWCAAEEPGEVAGPCIMGYDADADEGDRWASREDTGCWEPGPVTHWRSRPVAPGQEDTMGVIDGMGVKHHLFTTRAEEDAAVARSPLKVAQDLMALAERVGAAITSGVPACPKCGDSGWVPNRDANGERAWTPLMNDALPCDCGALARKTADGVAGTVRRQYYYRTNGCTATDAKDPACVCWHDEGTGPRADADPSLLEWRDAAGVDVPVEGEP